MKGAIWFLIFVAYVLCCVLIPIAITIAGPTEMVIMIIAGVAAFVLFGTIAHILATKVLHNEGGKAALAAYIVSFPCYLAVFVLLFILLAIIKFIDIMISLFTGGEHNLSSVINFLFGAAFGKRRTSPSSDKTEQYVVYEDGHERVLTPIEIKTDHDVDSPFFSKNYVSLKDDLGNYWRSYDNNENFIKETVEQRSRGY